MKKLLRKLFCRHNYEKIAWYEAYDSKRNERYATRVYRCTKCGKRIEVDGRCHTPFYVRGRESLV